MCTYICVYSSEVYLSAIYGFSPTIVPTTTTSSPCTPVLTNSSVVQTSLVSPCTPHASTPLTNLPNTTPINSSRTPGSLAGQLVDQGVVSTSQGQLQKQLPYTPQQQQQQASNGIYVQDPTMGGVGGMAVGFVGMGGVNLTSPQTVHMGPLDAGGEMCISTYEVLFVFAVWWVEKWEVNVE